MKITLCAYDAPKSIDGPTTWIKRLLPYLRRNGIETRLLFIAHQTKHLDTLAYFQKLNFECVLVPADLFFEEQIKRILEDVIRYPPDVFVPNYFPAACYAGTFARKAGIPSVIILHNDDALHRTLAVEFGENNKKDGISTVVAVSKRLESDIKAMQLANANVTGIPYGAPMPVTKTRWAGEQNLKLVYLGRLNNHQKRIRDVAKVLCRVTRELPNVEGIIYGNGPALQEVLAILQTEGRESRVAYGGIVSTSEIQKKLLENHVYVLLSEYEGIPIALMEAMACGVVPVCSNIKSGITELLKNDANGMIVEDRDEAFVQAIKELVADRGKWERLSSAARKTIAQEYTEDICNERWRALLQKLAMENTFKGKLQAPSLRQLRQLRVRSEFLINETRFPSPVVRPLYRLKKKIGLLKRLYFG